MVTLLSKAKTKGNTMSGRYSARDVLIDIVNQEDKLKAEREWELSKVDNLDLIQELYGRGVEIKDIFGRYLEFEVAGDGRTMDVEDALLTFSPHDDRSF